MSWLSLLRAAGDGPPPGTLLVVLLAVSIALERRTADRVHRIWQQRRAMPMTSEPVARIARYKRNQEIAFACIGLAFNAMAIISRADPFVIALGIVATLVRQCGRIVRAHRFVISPRLEGAVVTQMGSLVFLERDDRLLSWYVIRFDAVFLELYRNKPPTLWN